MILNNHSKPYQVLCIEDNSADVELIRFLFEQTDPTIQVHFVSDGLAGADFLFKRGPGSESAPTPDLIIMDLNMPKMDGRTLMRELKNHGEMCRIPVVMLSTSNSAREVGDCYCLGASAFINKPTDIAKFQEIVDKIVGFYFNCLLLPTRPGKKLVL